MKKRYYGLDILRFALAMFVVIGHFLASYKFGFGIDANIPIFGFPFYLKTLGRAVDVFFVLSGFTMVYSTMRMQTSAEFLQKRFARVFPLYIIVTLVAVAVFINFPFIDSVPRKYTLDFIVNSLILRSTEQAFPAVVAWTLAYEIIFYVIFAISMRISHKHRVTITTGILCGFMLISSIYVYRGTGYLSILMNPSFFFVEFIAGMFIGLYVDKIKLRFGWFLCILGMVVAYMFIFTPAYESLYRGLYFVVPSVIMVLGAIAIDVPKSMQKLARKLGDISYPMYITHIFTGFTLPIILRKVFRLQTFPILWTLVAIVLTIVLSLVVNKFIEKPLYTYFTRTPLKVERPEKLFALAKKYKKSTVIAIVASLFLIDFGMTKMLDDRPAWKVTRVISNKGTAEEIPHTFAAYDLAIKYGSHYIEPDVVLSKNGTLYVSNKASAKELTGVDKLFINMTDKEIDSLRISKNLTQQNLKILKLQDVFDRYQTSVNYVIDLKENVKQVAKVMEIIKKNKLEKNVIVQATKAETLERLEKVMPSVKKMLHVSNAQEMKAAVKNKSIDIVGIFKTQMTEANIRFIHENGKEVSVWTLNTTEEINRAIKLNVDSYFTDFTGKAIMLEKEAWDKK